MTWIDGYAGDSARGGAVWLDTAGGWCWEAWGPGWRTGGDAPSFATALQAAEAELVARVS